MAIGACSVSRQSSTFAGEKRNSSIEHAQEADGR